MNDSDVCGHILIRERGLRIIDRIVICRFTRWHQGRRQFIRECPPRPITLKRAQKMSRDNENGKYIFPMCHGGHHVHLQTGRNGYALTCRLMVIAAGGREDDKIHAKMQFRNVSSLERTRSYTNSLKFQRPFGCYLRVYDYIIPQNVCDASDPPSLSLSSSNDRVKYNCKRNYNRITYSFCYRKRAFLFYKINQRFFIYLMLSNYTLNYYFIIL